MVYSQKKLVGSTPVSCFTEATKSESQKARGHKAKITKRKESNDKLSSAFKRPFLKLSPYISLTKSDINEHEKPQERKISSGVKEIENLIENLSLNISQNGQIIFKNKHQAFSIFEFRKTLGTGTFGVVKLAKVNKERLPASDSDKSLPNFVAIKTMKKSAIIRYKQVDHINNERSILLKIDHPFTYNSYGGQMISCIFDYKISCYGSFQDDQNLYLILEPVQGGEFFFYLRKQKSLQNDDAKFYASQVCEIFNYLHGLDLIYRDLKPENLLIFPDGYLKIADFGFAKHVTTRSYTICGTPEYIAPEMLLNKDKLIFEGYFHFGYVLNDITLSNFNNKGHTKSVDWWTLGVFIYEMLVGRPPFFDDEPIGIYKKIIDGHVSYPLSMDRHARQLISKLLEKDLTKRWGNLANGGNDIKHCRWLSGIDFIELFNKRIKSPYIPKLMGEDDYSLFEAPEENEFVPGKIVLFDKTFEDW